MPLSRTDVVQPPATAGAGLAPAGPGAAPDRAPDDSRGSGSAPGQVPAPGQASAPGYGPLIDDPAGLLALPAGFSYRVVARREPSGAGCPAPQGDRTPWGTWLTCGAGGDGGWVTETDPGDRRADAGPPPVRALGRLAPRAVVADPRRGHLYLIEDATGPEGLLYRWTPPRDFEHGPGRLAALGAADGALQAFRCFDSGGRFVPDLSRTTRIGTVYGVDWVDVPDRAARQAPLRAQFTGACRVTRAARPAGMWWDDGGAYLVCCDLGADAAVRDRVAVWFYNPARRTLTLKVLLGFPGQPAPGGASGSGPVVARDGAGGHHLHATLSDGRTYPLARHQQDGGSGRLAGQGGFTGWAFSPDGGTLFAGIGAAGVVVAVTGPWHRPARATPGAGAPGQP